VVGGIEGAVTADIDVETGVLALHVTRQTGEQVTYRYILDETGTTVPSTW
jgi:hypothetical protein